MTLWGSVGLGVVTVRIRKNPSATGKVTCLSPSIPRTHVYGLSLTPKWTIPMCLATFPYSEWKRFLQSNVSLFHFLYQFTRIPFLMGTWYFMVSVPLNERYDREWQCGKYLKKIMVEKIRAKSGFPFLLYSIEIFTSNIILEDGR